MKFEAEKVFEGYTSAQIEGVKEDHRAGAIYMNLAGQNLTFATGVVFKNNTSEQVGGAIEVQAGTVDLKDAVITGNKADTWGGAIRMAGNSRVNLTVTKDTVYSGNKANAKGKLDYPDMGDFVYMNGATTDQKTALYLKAEGDATLTVADSIASAGSNNEITTEGKVNVTGSMEAYTGNITVKKGSEFTLAGGFGSYDLWTDSNNRDYNSLSQSKLKVEKGGKASLGDLKITRSAIEGYDSTNKVPTGGLVNGTILEVVSGGELSVNSITVTSQKYSDKFTSYGMGKLDNMGTATVKEHITVEAGGKFDMTGDVTVGRINTAAAVDLEGTDKDLAAGVITHTGGTLTLNNGKSVNNGQVTLDKVVLDKGAVLETSVDTAKFSFNELTLNEGTTLNVTEYNSTLEAARKKLEPGSVARHQYSPSQEGGALAYKERLVSPGSIKVGMKSTRKPSSSSNAYGFKNLTLGESGTVTVSDAGSLDIGTLHMKNTGGKIKNNGKVTIGAADITNGVQNTQFDNSGEVYTSVGLLVKKGEGENGADVLTNFGGLFMNDTGIVYDTSLKGNYTLADIKKLQTLGLVNFGYLNGNLVADAEEGGNVSWGDITAENGVGNLIAGNAVIDAKPEGTEKKSVITLDENKSVTVGGFDVGTAETVAVTTKGDQSKLAIVGDDLFAGSALESVTFVGKNITLGDSESNGVINAKVLLGQADKSITTAVEIKGNQSFNDGLVFNMADSQLTIAKDASLKVTGGVDFAFANDNPESILVNGDLEADWVADKKGGVVVNTNGAFAQLGNEPAKAEKTGEAEANAYAGALVTPKSKFADGAENALMSFGADLATAKAAMAEVAGEDNTRNFVYIAKQLDNSGAAFSATNTDFIIDLASVAATEGFKAEEGVVNGTINVATDDSTMVHLKNLTGAAMTGEAGNKSLKLTSKDFEGDGKNNVTVDYGTVFYGNQALNADAPTVGTADAHGTISFSRIKPRSASMKAPT